MSNISARKTAGILLAAALLMLITLGGFGGFSSTDASWSDQTTVHGSYRAAPLDEPTDPPEDPPGPGDAPTEPEEEPTQPEDAPTEPEEVPPEPEDEPGDEVEDPSDRLEGHITNLQCKSGQNTGDEKPIILTWAVPAAWHDHDIVYDVAWQDNVLTNYSKNVTVDERTFGPFFPRDFPGTANNQHADLTFTIQAKLADGEWQSDAIAIDAHGPTHGGVLHCGTSNRR